MCGSVSSGLGFVELGEWIDGTWYCWKDPFIVLAIWEDTLPSLLLKGINLHTPSLMDEIGLQVSIILKLRVKTKIMENICIWFLCLLI